MSPAYAFRPATRNHYRFHYVLSDTGKLIADDSKGESRQYQIRSGQGFMIFTPARSQHILPTKSKKLPWEYTWLEFDGMRAREVIETAKPGSPGLPRFA